MRIKYVKVQDILAERQLPYMGFGFFDNSGSVIKIMQWQPKGTLSFSMERGFCCADQEHAEKAESFIKEACKKKADIVITPEYSFPWSCVRNIMGNEEMRPGRGKLYCLGMEGISCDELRAFITQNDQKDNVHIITEKLEELDENYFFSCLLYLFRAEGKIVCLIQLKTTAASDTWSDLEAKGLTKGTTIYLFKSLTAEYYLFSYICADVLNQEIESIKSEIPYQECLILHPQLNPKPLHETFEQMRRNYLDYDRHNTRIIGLNWAKDTVLPREGTRAEIKVQESFSACYYNGNWNDKEEENLSLLIRNKAKGIDLAIEGHSIIWYMPDSEHCMFYTIDGFPNRMLSNVTGIHKEPVADTYYEYSLNEALWKSGQGCRVCRIDWEWLQQTFEIAPCINAECAVSLLYRFFAILLASRECGDFIIEHGKIQTIFNKEAAQNDALSIWRERCSFVEDALKDGKVPLKFVLLRNGNYRWILDYEGNLTTKDADSQYPKYNVMFIESSQEAIIKKNIGRFVQNRGQAACDRLIIYYMSVKGVQYYDKIYNTNINNPDNTHSVNSII